MASRGCKHKQECCHSCLNFTRLCNIIKLRHVFTFSKSLNNIPCWNKSLLPDCVPGQLYALPTLTTYFPKMHLNVILPPFLQSYHCILKWISTQMLYAFLVSSIWASPLFQTARGSHVSKSSMVSNIPHYRESLVTSNAALNERVPGYCSCSSIVPWLHGLWGKLKGSHRTGPVFVWHNSSMSRNNKIRTHFESVWT